MLAVQEDADKIISASAKAAETRRQKAEERALARGEDPAVTEAAAAADLEAKAKAAPPRGPEPDSMSFVRHVTPVSASTGAGIKQLWKRICAWADQDAIRSSSSDTAVKEHRLARLMRHTRAASLRTSRGRGA